MIYGPLCCIHSSFLEAIARGTPLTTNWCQNYSTKQHWCQKLVPNTPQRAVGAKKTPQKKQQSVARNISKKQLVNWQQPGKFVIYRLFHSFRILDACDCSGFIAICCMQPTHPPINYCDFLVNSLTSISYDNSFQVLSKTFAANTRWGPFVLLETKWHPFYSELPLILGLTWLGWCDEHGNLKLPNFIKTKTKLSLSLEYNTFTFTWITTIDRCQLQTLQWHPSH